MAIAYIMVGIAVFGIITCIYAYFYSRRNRSTRTSSL
jgi:hypothetical protein